MPYYSTDSEEHQVNIGAIKDPADEFEQDVISDRQDIEALQDYLDELDEIEGCYRNIRG